MAEARREKEVADAEEELTRLWRAWRTVKEMVQDRGYEIHEDEVRISLEEFRQQYTNDKGNPDRSKMKFSARPSDEMLAKYGVPPSSTSASSPTDPPPPRPPHPIGMLWVEFFPFPDKDTGTISVATMRAFIHHVAAENFSGGILIAPVPMSASALKAAPAAAPAVIETFLESDLLVNITHHELVPKHVLLSRDEKTALLKRYRLKESQLPRIQVNDPVARYLGLRRGQVVKIIRRSETAGRYASYRWCI